MKFIVTLTLKLHIDSADLRNFEQLDTAVCELEGLFKPINLPLQIDYDFLMKLRDKKHEALLSENCFLGNEIYMDYNMPISIYIPLGLIIFHDTTIFYCVITAPNPNNPMDFAHISASIFEKHNNKLINEIEIAKYEAGGGITEEYYCTIKSSGIISQNYKHTGEYEGKKEVFKIGDTIINLLNNKY